MQPLFIGPYEIGVQQNLKPFMLPESAFPDLLNAFVFRGRVERKDGYTFLGRLRRELTTVSSGNITAGGAGSFTFNLFTGMGLLSTEPEAQLEPGNITTITIVIGAQTLNDTLGNGTMSIVGAGAITAASINYATGVLTLTFSGAFGPTSSTFSGAYYPTLPVMGIRTRDVPGQINDEQTIFFDTKYAYRFSSQFEELPSTLVTTWSGADYQQFWTTNFQVDALSNPLFWATNNVPGLPGYAVTLFASAAAGPPSTVDVTAAGNTFGVGDVVYFVNLSGAGAANNLLTGTVTVPGNTFTISNPGTGVFTNGAITGGYAISPDVNVSGNGDGIRYYSSGTWTNLTPVINPNTVLQGCLMLIAYKNRMLALNTWEGVPGSAATNFPQRVRWSQNAPEDTSASIDYINGWRSDITGRGGFVDAPTGEQIVSAGFVKDTLIVYFESSTWQLTYTGNEILPFVWQRINAELGAESTFSAVQFDNGLIAFGNVGIHTSNGVTVKRIDEVIPDEVFNAHNNVDGPLRTSGIRDFYKEVVYLAYANNLQNTPLSAGKTFFPNKIICYNYRNHTFSFFDDNVTSFGYFQRVNDLTWAQLTTFPWEAWNMPWNAGVLSAQFPNIAFGNQQGFVSLIQPDISSNNQTLTIQAMTPGTISTTITSPQHNLFEGQYVRITGSLGSTNLNNQTFMVVSVTDEDHFVIDGVATGTYIGQGVMTVLTNIIVQTKQFTPFWSKGKCYDLRYFDVLFDKTEEGQVGVAVYIDFNTSDNMEDQISSLGAPIMATSPEGTDNPYYSFQRLGAQIWKRFYADATGETFQIKFSFTDTEMRDRDINESDFVVHAMILYFSEVGAFY